MNNKKEDNFVVRNSNVNIFVCSTSSFQKVHKVIAALNFNLCLVILSISKLAHASKPFSRLNFRAVASGEAGKAKGQLISECPFGVIVLTKIPTKILAIFCPRI